MTKHSFDLEKLVRTNIRKLVPYASARAEHRDPAGILLDANENALGSVLSSPHNRYPDPVQQRLRENLAGLKGLAAEQVFVGNGSDESIDLLIRAFCEPRQEAILITPPTYGMYAVSAATNDVQVREVPLGAQFELEPENCLREAASRVKLIFLCSPNNPTGNLISRAAVIALLEKFNGLVVVDEAYIDYAPGQSLLPLLAHHPNLVILQTLSKAWGLANLRVGFTFAAPDIIEILLKIKPPYNVSGVTQELALEAFARQSRQQEMVQTTIAERERLCAGLRALGHVERVHPSAANFLLVQFEDAAAACKGLLESGILVRDRSRLPQCAGCLRITVGTPAENDLLLATLQALEQEHPPVRSGGDQHAMPAPLRTATVHRKTSETEIHLFVNLDGAGSFQLDTGLGFFDHMLAQLARHSRCDLHVHVRGDLHVDEHHTIEDTALALGEAFRRALGDKKGIERYGFLLPMDEALAQVALDFSGRSWLVWQVAFSREKIGDVPTEMFFHFFKSFSDAAGCTLNIQAEGENEHHKIEAIFKAVGRAIRGAVRRDPNMDEIPSTKGTL